MIAESILAQLIELSRLPDDELCLATAFLFSSMYANPSLEPHEYISALDALADGARRRLDGLSSPTQRLAAFIEYMALECGFHGNEERYYDPRNSFFHEVIETRVGIPITLSVIYMEVGRRAGVPFDAISFPFHFLISPRGIEDTFIDPYYSGRRLDRAQCEEFLAQRSNGSVEFTPRYLAPVGARAVLVRMMRNLKMAHVRAQEYVEAIDAIDVLLVWAPQLTRERRDRGLLWAKLGCFPAAIPDLQAYLDEFPDASDRQRIQMELENARSQFVVYN